ncbi:MAG: H-NS histone family protein [Gammaproteobacteria bacterium]|nr:H-NS histone family protein [Gammaproteobacteria bacterium]MCP5424297.1 H-NS histone family protein [Gammaproteobacteria bacterium]MCP5459050.1 H-NS histone family protein [Gammaproteobacteria bacterium]
MISIDDLKDMSIEALQGLITNAQDLVSQYEKDKKKDVIKKIQALAASVNLNVEVKETEKALKPTAKGVVKYMNPENSKQTWTGRGKRPKWLNEALDAGKTLDDLMA